MPPTCRFLQRSLIRSYSGWQGVERFRQEHIICIGVERILGLSEFVESRLRDDLSGKARGGKLSNAKAILCYLGKTELGLTIREISNFLSISQPSTTI